jgi:hypothetical protein
VGKQVLTAIGDAAAAQTKLRKHAEKRWPQCEDVTVKSRGGQLYVSAIADGDTLPLCRLRFVGPGDVWEFGYYSAASRRYEANLLPTGSSRGNLLECFDCAAGTHLAGIGPRPVMDFATFLKLEAAARRKSSGRGA